MSTVEKQRRSGGAGMGAATALAVCMAAAMPAGFVLAAEPAGVPLAQAGQVDFNIPAQPLTGALTMFGDQAGMQVTVDTAILAGRAAPAVSGRMGAEEALRRLLAGTGIVWRFTDAATVVLEKAAADGAMTLDPVTVEGVARGHAVETAHGPVVGYVAKRTATGTKTDTPIVEVPQTINVVTADQMKATKAQTLNDALAYTPGIVIRQGADRTSDSFTMRGFQVGTNFGSLYRDGSKYLVNSFDGQIEPYGLERIEVLKGASSVLFGSAAPGGIINTVTKRPTIEPLREINVEAGTYDHRQVSGDFGGALTEDGKWSYRLTALKRDADTFIDHVADDRDYLASALTWRPSEDTSLTLLGQYQKSHTTYLYGLPAGVTILPNPNGRVSSSTFVGEPGLDRADSTVMSAGYLFEHAFSHRLTLRNKLNYAQSETDYPMTGISGLAADGRTTTWRGVDDLSTQSSAITTDTSLELKWATGPVDHTSIAGIDYTDQNISSARYSRTAANIDLYAPSYGTGLGAPTPNGNAYKGTASRLGVYAQNQMKVHDKVALLLGGRQDWTEDRRSPYFGAESWTSQHNDAFTGRAGLVYLADNGLAPFVSYSESFEPQGGTDRLGRRFEPTTGQQYEAGLRYQPPGTNAMVTGAVYQLTRQNVTTPDPVNGNYSVQIGEVRSRGFELEAKAELTPYFNLIGAYAYTDARVTKSNNLTELGRRNATVPYNQFSLWGDYNLGELRLPEVTAGLGMRYQDSTLGFTAIKAEVPSYTVFDAMVRYDMDNWRFSVNATNLFDKEYIASCTFGCFFGDRRKVVGTLTYRW